MDARASITEILALLIHTLAARSTQCDLIFLRNIFFGKTDSSFLIGCFSLHVPGRPTQNTSLFRVPFARDSTVKTGTFVRLAMTTNDFIRRNPRADLFADDVVGFKSSVVTYATSVSSET